MTDHASNDNLERLVSDDERPETGPVQFGDDWPGVFFRGDDAAGYAIILESLLCDRQAGELLTPLAITTLKALLSDLRTANQNDPSPKTKLLPWEDCKR